MNNAPKRTKILLGVLGVLVIVMVYMQLGGGGGESTTVQTPPSIIKKTKPSTTQDQNGNGGSASGLPADPTSPARPGTNPAEQITPPGGFPNTEPPVISYNPFLQPKTSG